MRKKINPDKKRSQIIGIKVQPETREKLKYIVKRDQTTLSSLINTIIIDYIENYFKITKIEWEKLTPEEKAGEDSK